MDYWNHVLWSDETKINLFGSDGVKRALLKKLRVKVMNWSSMSLDLNPTEHLRGILKQKVEERKVSNIHQLRDVVMEEWKRTPANLWSSGELYAQEG